MPKIIATKEDWVALGYQLFAQQGVSGVIVEKMASTLKVNKSSFYWHFKTKKDFIEAIISYWVSTHTNDIISTTESQQTGKEKFEKLVELSFKKEPHLDFIFFLKRYALKNKRIQSIIDQIDNQRINYTKDLLLEMGFSTNEAISKANLFYKYLIGYHEMIRYKKQPKSYMNDVRKELNQFIKY